MSNFKFEFLRLFLKVKGSFMPIFIKIYKYLGPLEFVGNENFDMLRLAWRKLKIWNRTSEIITDLWLVDLF